jgi:hypothetical protein
MKMHEAVRSVLADALSGSINIHDDSELDRHVAKACSEQELDDHGYLAEFKSIASSMVRYFRLSRLGYVVEAPTLLRLLEDNIEITIRPDDVLVGPGGVRSFRRVRTGHMYSNDEDNVGAAIFLLAAREADSNARAELVHLSDEAVTSLDLSATVLKNRKKKLSDFLGAIRGGMFPANPSEYTCPGCPAFFICGPTPPGVLERNF